MELKGVLHFGLLIMRGYTKAMESNIEAFARKHGLAAAHFYILYILSFEEELTVGEIAQLGLWHNSTVTRLLTSLKKKELISVEVNKQDNRIITVKLTPEGSRLIKKMNKDALEDRNFLSFFKTIYESDPKFIEESIKTSLVFLDKMQSGKYVDWLENTHKKIDI